MKLSIIIPAYNVEKYLPNTLTSLINQEEKDFEVLVIDDGSTDQTYHVAEKMLSNSLLHYKVIKKENGGVSSARNRGLSEAIGKYIFFLDGDDYVTKDFVEILYRYIDKERPDVICWGHNKVREDLSTESEYFNEFQPSTECMTGAEVLKNILIKKNMWLWTGSVAYKKELLISNHFRYDETCTGGEDHEFMFKALSRANKVTFINQVLSYYLQRTGSLTNKYNIRKFDVIEAHQRVAHYFSNLAHSELSDVTHALTEEYFIIDYLANFETNLRYLLKSYPFNQSLTMIYRDIEQQYPDLNEKVRLKMRNYTGNNIILAWKIKMFLLSPRIYLYVLSLARILKKNYKFNFRNLFFQTKP